MRKCATPDCTNRTSDPTHPSRLCAICRRRLEARFAAEDALGDAFDQRKDGRRCSGCGVPEGYLHSKDCPLAQPFDDPDAPDAGGPMTEAAILQAREAVAEAEAMLADLQRQEQARQAEVRDETFSMDVALTEEAMEAMSRELSRAREEAMRRATSGEDHIPRNKYHREIATGVWVDVYDVLAAWGVDNPALQHLVKKALQAGQRGHKTREEDLDDIIDSAYRAKELES